MTAKHILATTAIAITALAAPAMATADIGQELKAAGAVERAAMRRYRGYDIYASCDQTSSRKFWCQYSGTKGTKCIVTGHARVTRNGRRYTARLVSGSTTCF